MMDGLAVHVTGGFWFTNTVTDADPEQPFLKPVTEYVVVFGGLTTMEAPD
jgi:hypothetical protein